MRAQVTLNLYNLNTCNLALISIQVTGNLLTAAAQSPRRNLNHDAATTLVDLQRSVTLSHNDSTTGRI